MCLQCPRFGLNESPGLACPSVFAMALLPQSRTRDRWPLGAGKVADAILHLLAPAKAFSTLAGQIRRRIAVLSVPRGVIQGPGCHPNPAPPARDARRKETPSLRDEAGRRPACHGSPSLRDEARMVRLMRDLAHLRDSPAHYAVCDAQACHDAGDSRASGGGDGGVTGGCASPRLSHFCPKTPRGSRRGRVGLSAHIAGSLHGVVWRASPFLDHR